MKNNAGSFAVHLCQCTDQLGPLERLIRLHRELAVHVDDLDIVAHLLERAQEQVSELQNRLAFYEPATRS